jgi:23S rRNA (guanosine2251-2'-O)-methyltransferase
LLAKGHRQPHFHELAAMARRQGVPLEAVPREQLDRLSRTRGHQGIIAIAAELGYVELDEVVSRSSRPFLVALDELQDPQNLGAILRSADAAGIDAVICTSRRSAGLSPGTLKAAAGAAEHVPVVRAGNLARTLGTLKQRGLWVVGADPTADRVYWDADLSLPLVLVIGGEHRGLRRLTRENCDYLVRIPMVGKLNSLNAAAAAAILMFEAHRQRRGSPPLACP